MCVCVQGMCVCRGVRAERCGWLLRCARSCPSTDQLSCVLVLLTWCWLCLQSTPQTQSANVTESSDEEEEQEEEAALAEDAGSEEAAGEGQEETDG